MMTTECRLLALFCILLVVEPSTALKCYVCSTISSSDRCQDPFNATEHAADECDVTTAACLKQVLSATGLHSAGTHRGCADQDYCRLFEKQSKHCSICGEDFCNVSLCVSPHVNVLISTVGLNYLYKRIATT